MATVLIADDNTSNRALLTGLLGSQGHVTLEATNGAEAIGLAVVHLPDVVIADLLMPKVDGYDFIRQLRTNPATSGTAVVIYTANYAAKEVREFAEEFNVAKVLTKPTDTRVIQALVDKLLTASTETAVDPPGSGSFNRGHLELLNAKLLQRTRELELAKYENSDQLAKLLRIYEEEHDRIAGALLDGPIEAFTTAAMKLDVFGEMLADEQLREKHAAASDSVDHAIVVLRRALWQLRSPNADLERDGLGGTLAAFARHITDASDAAVDVQDDATTSLRSEMCLLAYRICQEAIVNAVRHAHASRIEVTLRDADGGILMRIADDGIGFDPDQTDRNEPRRLGLQSMRERAELGHGWCRLDSEPDGGTTVECWLPADLAGIRSAG